MPRYFEKGSVIPKYDNATRLKLRRRLRKLLREDLPREKMLGVLRLEGIARPDGSPIDLSWLQNQLHFLAKDRAKRLATRKPYRRRAKQADTRIPNVLTPPVASSPQPATKALVVPTSIELMLEDTDLTDVERLELFRHFLNTRRKTERKI